MRLLLVLCCAGLFHRTAPAEAALGLPPGFQRELVYGSLSQPTAIAFAPDGQLFIAQKNGVVRVIKGGVMQSQPFIDLSAEVNNVSDRGLLGLAIHPDFPATPYVYLLYTYDPPGVTRDGDGSRVARLLRVEASASNPGVADTAPESRVVLLGTNSTLAYIGDAASPWSFDNPACRDQATGGPARDCLAADSTTHTIGNVVFAPDGALLVSNGDGAMYVGDVRTMRSLDLNSLSGKLLRIDPLTGAGLPDNPFYDGDPQSNASKVFQYGLRNPFRFSVNPASGQIVIGDVGWNTWEEINTGGAGANFGWPCYEGGAGTNLRQPYYAGASFSQATCAALYAQPAAVTSPIYSYDHALGGAAALAGAVYMGGAYPEQYHGAVFIADYNRNWIKYVTFQAGQPTVHDFASEASPISGLGPVHVIVGPDSNLYYSDIHSIYRIRHTAGGNTPPTAAIGASATDGPAPLQVSFSGAGSFDPDAQALSYSWEFGDGGSSTEVSPTRTYTAPGSYTVRLTVRDTQGATGTAELTVTAGNTAPTVTMLAPGAADTYRIGDTIALSGAAVDPEDGALGGASLQWAVHMHHNEHVHQGVHRFSGPTASFHAEHHGNNTWLEICLTATDSGGLARTTCRPLQPQPVTLYVETSPPGARVIVEGVALTTPFELRVPAGSPQLLTALSTDDLAFARWAGGSAVAERQVIAEAGMAPLRAEFSLAPGALMYRAVNLAGSPVFLDGWQWEGGDAPRLATNGASYTNQNATLRPATDPARATMIRSSLRAAGGDMYLTMAGIPDGVYYVYLYVWDDGYNMPANLHMEGRLLLRGYTPGNNGAWARLGPYRAEIADGTLALATGVSRLHVSGIEVWHAGSFTRPTPTASNTPTITRTPTSTSTPTSTNTPTNTPTSTPTNTPTNTPTSTSTPTGTLPPTATSTSTSTPTNTPTGTPPPTATSTGTPSATSTDTLIEEGPPAGEELPGAKATATPTASVPAEDPAPTATSTAGPGEAPEHRVFLPLVR